MKNACLVFAFLCLAVGSVGHANLSTLPEMKPYQALRVSSYDRSGGNADGQNILPKPGETVALAELSGPGEVTHIWVTIASPEPDHLRKLVLRMYWDGEEHPSVEAPIGDFFGLGHAQYYHFSSQPIAIGTNNGMNCFWLMPFSKSARITLTHEGEKPLRAFYYYIDYRVYPEDDANAVKTIAAQGRFHAQYRQLMPTVKGEDYTLLEAQGQGHYVGCNLSIQLNSDGWWGEGDDKIYVDGETFPSFMARAARIIFAEPGVMATLSPRPISVAPCAANTSKANCGTYTAIISRTPFPSPGRSGSISRRFTNRCPKILPTIIRASPIGIRPNRTSPSLPCLQRRNACPSRCGNLLRSRD